MKRERTVTVPCTFSTIRSKALLDRTYQGFPDHLALQPFIVPDRPMCFKRLLKFYERFRACYDKKRSETKGQERFQITFTVHHVSNLKNKL